jgi:hypothetical protein
MFEHLLDPVKGWFHLAALDKTAPMDSAYLPGGGSEDVDVFSGMVAHLEEDSVTGDPTFRLGGANTQMPIFLLQGKDDADVSNNGVSPTTDVTHWISISPSGRLNGLVATGKYELQTTEFLQTEVALNAYACNEPLSAGVAGLLFPNTIATAAQVYRDWICGICSSHVNGDNQSVGLGAVTAPDGPVGTNAHGVLTLTFWPYFLPAAPGPR